jgi:hypothetical protein
MELDVTHMVEDADEMPMLSGSRVELGQNAGDITWLNSVLYGAVKPLLKTDEEREAARDHFRGYGAWTREQIDAWSEAELQGIVCQEVASAIREAESFGFDADSYEEYREACESGRVSGRLYRGDNERWYFYIGE